MTRTDRSGKLTTGNINLCIMHGLIFCFRVGGPHVSGRDLSEMRRHPGGNFVYRNYRNRGGVFSNPADRSPLEMPPLPVCADDRPRECRWVFDGSSLGVEAFVVIRPDVERTISRPA